MLTSFSLVNSKFRQRILSMLKKKMYQILPLSKHSSSSFVLLPANLRRVYQCLFTTNQPFHPHQVPTPVLPLSPGALRQLTDLLLFRSYRYRNALFLGWEMLAMSATMLLLHAQLVRKNFTFFLEGTIALFAVLSLAIAVPKTGNVAARSVDSGAEHATVRLLKLKAFACA